MCGIAGLLHRDASRPATLDELKPMLDRIAHRGPDDWGHHLDGALGFGMRRLSIIDLSSGHQPIHNEDKTVWTVFNGEIYNFVELRPMLEKKGHRFYTNTDTEVIVHLWEEYGPDFVNHLRGMFGIAVWDSRTKQLMLVRDRLGIKPIYYKASSEGVYFGSELKALLAHDDVEPEVDYEAVRLYLQMQYVPAPKSILKGVSKLPPGHFALVTDGHVRVAEYWDAPLNPDPNPQSFDEYREELEHTLAESVKMRLISDVPLGVFLSGGIDSSTITALMARQMDEPVKTFSIGFDYQKYDELPYARQIAERFGTDHHEERVHADAIEVLPKLVWHYDEPFADSSAIPTYYVSRLAKQHVTVVLSGDGGDELFAGYDRYRVMEKYYRLYRLLGPFRRPLSGLAAMMPIPLRKQAIANRFGMSLEDTYREYMSQFSQLWLERVAPSGPLSPPRESDGPWSDYWSRSSHRPYLERLGYIDMKTYLPDDILTKVDRASMAVSLEARVPMLDHKVVELAARMPYECKMRAGTSKAVLKEIIGQWTTPEFLTRPKMGFGVPIGEWFRHELRDFVRDRLTSQRARERGLFDMQFVTQLIDDHQKEEVDHSAMLWSLLFLEEWFRLFVDNEKPPQAS